MSYETPILTAGISASQRIWESVTDPQHDVGTRGQMIDGRSFYYACNRSSAINIGFLLSNSPVDVDCDDLAIATLEVGATSAELTFASTKTYAANELTGGFMQVNSGTNGNEGRQYRITGNPATTANTEFTLDFEPIREENFSANATVTIVPNAYSAVTVSANVNSLCVGLTVSDIPAGTTDPQFFWAQTWGHACCISGAASDVLGHTLLVSALDGRFIGQVDLNGGGGAVDQLQQIGTNMFTTVSGDFMPIFLQIAP